MENGKLSRLMQFLSLFSVIFYSSFFPSILHAAAR